METEQRAKEIKEGKMGKLRIVKIGDKVLYKCKICGAKATGIMRATSPTTQKLIGVRQMAYLIDKNNNDLHSLPCGHSSKDLVRIL